MTTDPTPTALPDSFQPETKGGDDLCQNENGNQNAPAKDSDSSKSDQLQNRHDGDSESLTQTAESTSRTKYPDALQPAVPSATPDSYDALAARLREVAKQLPAEYQQENRVLRVVD